MRISDAIVFQSPENMYKIVQEYAKGACWI